MSKGNSTLCLMVTKGNTVGDRNRRKIYIDSMFGSLCWGPCIGDLKDLHFTARQGAHRNKYSTDVEVFCRSMRLLTRN